MSISNVHNANGVNNHSSAGATGKNKTAEATGASFAATMNSVTSSNNGTPYTDAEVKRFFAGKPTPMQIAEKAATLGLTKNQITRAMTVGGFGGSNNQTLPAQIEGFVANASNGYAWDANGLLTHTRTSAQAANSERIMPAAQDIRAFYASRPTEDQITAKVKELGLNAAQMVQFQATGIGMDMNKISAHVLETMYVDSANRLGTDIGGGRNGGWTSYFSPTLGRAINKSEMQAFFAGNPSQNQIFQKASELGLGVSAVNNMMIGLGITTAADMNSAYAQMDFNLFQGKDNYSLDQYGHIIPGGGKVFVGNADGSVGSWQPRTSGDGSTTVNTTA
ncbi:hypothetical protein HZ993_18785 [Rhodoferax sp. AJA081-3]|uniref:hypothetical protein n=1 Tax=Rhodoferax sp. AJA081-3 TaxID=2752316 RepID=UPI001ADF1E6D|nr:hypothetical protein [Rhodoferax sp. AJA081-3]QTN27312.1 hypothetical protein HZ993_18785 [Rhodoferax sp. AJA081-3]